MKMLIDIENKLGNSLRDKQSHQVQTFGINKLQYFSQVVFFFKYYLGDMVDVSETCGKF